MADETLEQIVNAPQAEKKEEPKRMSAAKNLVNESADILKVIGGASLAAAMPLTLGYFAPAMLRDALIISTAFSAGKIYENYRDQRKTRISDIVKEFAVGTLLTPFIHYGYGIMNAIENPLLKSATYLGPYTLGVIPAYLGIDHLVKKGFRRIYSEGIKPNLKRVLTDNYTYLALLGLVNLFLTPVPLQIPVALGLGFLFKVIAGKEEVKESEKRDTTPYLIAASNVANKFYGGLKSMAYDFGQGINNLSKSIPKSQPSPQMATATT